MKTNYTAEELRELQKYFLKELYNGGKVAGTATAKERKEMYGTARERVTAPRFLNVYRNTRKAVVRTA